MSSRRKAAPIRLTSRSPTSSTSTPADRSLANNSAAELVEGLEGSELHFDSTIEPACGPQASTSTTAMIRGHYTQNENVDQMLGKDVSKCDDDAYTHSKKPRLVSDEKMDTEQCIVEDTEGVDVHAHSPEHSVASPPGPTASVKSNASNVSQHTSTSASTNAVPLEVQDILAQTENGCIVIVEGQTLRELFNSASSRSAKLEALTSVIRQVKRNSSTHNNPLSARFSWKV
jgi:hypothetical protein